MLEVADTGRDMHQEMLTLMQKQKKHSVVGWKQNHKQNFRNGLNRRQEIQKKKIPEEEKIITQQKSIHLMMGAMETLRMGMEQIMLKKQTLTNQRDLCKLLYLNARGLINKYTRWKVDALKEYVSTNNIILMNFTETWLKKKSRM